MIKMWSAVIPRSYSSTESREQGTGQAMPLSYHVTKRPPPFPAALKVLENKNIFSVLRIWTGKSVFFIFIHIHTLGLTQIPFLGLWLLSLRTHLPKDRGGHWQRRPKPMDWRAKGWDSPALSLTLMVGSFQRKLINIALESLSLVLENPVEMLASTEGKTLLHWG